MCFQRRRSGWCALNLTRGEQSGAVALSLSVALQVAAPPSPDFDGSGLVGFPDFVLFAGAFGYREDDEKYGARYDLNRDGEDWI